MKLIFYIIYLLLGIIIYRLLNFKESLNISSQFRIYKPCTCLDENYVSFQDEITCTTTGQTESSIYGPRPTLRRDVNGNLCKWNNNPNTDGRTLIEMFREIVTAEPICDIAGVGDCSRTMLCGRGNCQLLTLTSLFNSIDAPFLPEDIDYINSFGNSFSGRDSYHCLLNKKNMEYILRKNNLDPTAYYDKPEDTDFNFLRKNSLYYLYFGLMVSCDDYFDLQNKSYPSFGHAVLIYVTDIDGLRRLIQQISQDEDYHERNQRILKENLYDKLSTKLALLDELPEDDNRKIGKIIIMIDYANFIFNAITELDYPQTVPIDLRSSYSSADRIRYDSNWKKKFLIEFFKPSFRYNGNSIVPMSNFIFIDKTNGNVLNMSNIDFETLDSSREESLNRLLEHAISFVRALRDFVGGKPFPNLIECELNKQACSTSLLSAPEPEQKGGGSSGTEKRIGFWNYRTNQEEFCEDKRNLTACTGIEPEIYFCEWDDTNEKCYYNPK